MSLRTEISPSPYNAEIMQILNTGDTRSPLQLFGLVYSSAKSLRSLRIYVLLWDRKAVQILYSDINFIWYLTSICFWYYNLHLVGLRRMRLCLKLRQGFALYPQWVSPLDPDQGRVPGPFARFARCFILLYACNLLWSAMLIPHSSLLIPHSSFPISHSSPPH